jgi:hypothetical protein
MPKRAPAQPRSSELRKPEQDCSGGNGANADHQEWWDRLHRESYREICRSP